MIMLRGLKQLNLPEIEEKVLDFWRINNIFQKSLEQRKEKNSLWAKLRKSKEFVFYEGPPTANGRPGTHHILVRVFKDIILRYKTMSGFYVPRKAGWDTQGLPVEIEVEKQLGIKHKQEIEKLGIAEFNRKAKESVWKYKDEWEKLTERMGYWLDFKESYITYENSYLEELWGLFKKIDQNGLLYKGYKILPWCPRCVTGLSSHELALGYKEVSDQSVYIRFKIKDQKSKIKNNEDDLYILSWTTTPWTLPGNVALAINPKDTFVLVDNLILEKSSAARLGFNFAETQELSADDLIGLKYEPLFSIPALQSETSHRIYSADFVLTGEGTGVVHTAVMYGEDDYNLGIKIGLPQQHTVDEQGNFTKAVSEFAGLSVTAQATTEKILEYLKNQGSLFKTESHLHDYPFCWRCGTRVLYYAHNSWFIAMSRLRDQLLNENNKINWTPSHLQEGRFGGWLKEVKDWAISRDRYWGTPLPIWECGSCQERLVAGSLQDLNTNDFQKNKFFMVRHGQATNNAESWLATGKESDKKSQLTEKGLGQVKTTAENLKNKKIDIIYCSPFQRTRQTAQAIAEVIGNVEIIYDERIGELNTGAFDTKPLDEYHQYERQQLQKGYSILFSQTLPGGESFHDLKKRMMDFITDINSKHEQKNILIVSHEAPLWLLETALQGLDDEGAWNYWGGESFLTTGASRQLKFNNWPFDDNGNLDLHRPYIDKIYLRCSKCQGRMKRVKEVADVWFDSGAMPFACGEYPERYPADYICEAIDQTRGWFYTLLAIAVALKKGTPYKNVISLGHLLDKNGQKMSKSKGNIVDPWEIINKYGVDVVRWYFYTVNPPGEPKRFDEADLGKTQRRFVALLYNSYLFLQTYAGTIALPSSGFQNMNVLDDWIIARLQETIDQTTKGLDVYDIGGAAQSIENLVDDLSHWYIRRSRKRPEALPVLAYVLLEISKLIAPFMPFFAEALYQSLIPDSGFTIQKSVHLEDWPEAKKKYIDKELIKEMAEARRLASLALAKRAEVKIKVRQPLASLKIKNQNLKIKNEELLKILAEEVNVKEVVFDDSLSEELVLDTIMTPELKQEGLLRELVRLVQGLRQDAGYQAGDTIILFIEGSEIFKTLFQKYHAFKNDIHAKDIFFKKEPVDAEGEGEFDGEKVWLGIKKY